MEQDCRAAQHVAACWGSSSSSGSRLRQLGRQAGAVKCGQQRRTCTQIIASTSDIGSSARNTADSSKKLWAGVAAGLDWLGSRWESGGSSGSNQL